MKIIILRTVFRHTDNLSLKNIKKLEEPVYKIVKAKLLKTGLIEFKDFILFGTYGIGDSFKELEMEVHEV